MLVFGDTFPFRSQLFTLALPGGTMDTINVMVSTATNIV